MKLLSFNSLAVFALVVLSISAHALIAENRSEALPVLKKGIVVERLTEHFEAVKAGMRPGDVLLRWTRGEISAEIGSPFDLVYLRYEQASRGTLRIDGIRRRRGRSWSLGSDTWGIWARPHLSGSLLLKYQECEALPKATETGQAKKCWQAATDEARRYSVAWLESWFLAQAGQQFAISGDWNASDAAYAQALQQAAGAGSVVRGTLFMQWAYVLNGREDLVNAGRHYEDAIREWSQAGSETVAITTPLLELGLVALNQGDYGKAEASWRRALVIGERLAPGSIETILAYGNLAVLYQQKGELAKAEEYYRRAVAKEKKYLPRSRFIPQRLTNLGTLSRERGDLNAAEAYHREALDALKRLGLDNGLAADIFDNLADCFLDRNDLAKSEEYQRRALAIREKLLPQSLDVASSLSSLGFIAERKASLSQAEQYYQKALAIDERLAPHSLATADVIAGLGSVAQKRGDSPKAEEHFRNALAMLDKIAPESLKHGEVMASLAATMRRQGELDTAAVLYRQALADLESKAVQLGAFEENQSRYRARHASYYRQYVDLLVDLGQIESAFEVLEGSHARTLFEMLSRSRINIRQGTDPGLLAQERDLLQSLNAKSQYRILLLGGQHTEEKVIALDREIAVLRNSYEEIETQIGINSPSYAALTQPHSLSVREIQQQLDPDTLLIEYSLGEERSHVWVVSENSLQVYGLPSRVEIESAAHHVYKLLTARNRQGNISESKLSQRWAKADAEYTSAAMELSREVLAPIASLLGRKRLLVVSDGALQYVPFSVLPLPEVATTRAGGASHGWPLIVEHEIVNLPSASVVAELRRAESKRSKALKTVAILADPVFDLNDERIAQRTQAASPVKLVASSLPLPFKKGFAPARLTRSAADVGLTKGGEFYLGRLLYTRREADAIMALTPKGKGLEILDFHANRAAALSPRLAQYQIVHFATHGFLDNKHPELSGLVLSLVDKEGKPQDGFLQLEDIYNLNLPVELVVLSGCETGLGQDVSGEGLIGLTRGFMYAGSSRVVASLWSVNDVATSELMTLFYQGMERDKLRPAAALRAAQIRMLKQKPWSPPYYWAAFQIQGEWK